MEVFGAHWLNHSQKISTSWKERVSDRDLVLIAGDISWAMRLCEAEPDLRFIASLPGRKVLCKGNHDYWWASASKVRAVLPEGMFIIQNDALLLDGVAFGGSRLWMDHAMAPLDLPERKDPVAAMPDSPGKPIKTRDREENGEEDERIFRRELGRLEMSLGRMSPDAALKIALVHYPPISTDFQATRASRLLEQGGVRHCVFGHLHHLAPSFGQYSLAEKTARLGERNGVEYHLTSCDYLDFIPALITEI